MYLAGFFSGWFLMAAVATQPAVPPRIPLSAQQARALAEEIVMHTPERVHFAEGTTFSWVLFLRQANDPSPLVTQIVLELLGKKYVVYLSEAAVPPGKMTKQGMQLLDGFRFSFELRQIQTDTIEVNYSDSEGPLAASGQTFKYKWERTKWRVLSKGPLEVSHASPNPPLNPTVSCVTPPAKCSNRRAARHAG
jgi:hypothetical protein